jgi:SAM-dependent methyltransferase
MVQVPPAPSAAYFDGWYADLARSPARDELHRRHLGLPAHVLSTGSLNWDGLAEVTAPLRLSAGAALVDLGCGRGGYGLEIATRTGAALTGVDFSAGAIAQAAELARRLGQAAQFRTGTLAATGLADGFARAVVCLDAIQFADPAAEAYRELRRILAPGGRVALTCWEPLTPGDERIGVRLRRVDLGDGLRGAGFTEVEVTDRPDWAARERAMWAEAAALDPGDDAALRSFHDEAVRVLPTQDLIRRVLATATAP